MQVYICTYIYACASNFYSLKKNIYGLQNCGQLNFMAFRQEELWGNANVRIPWHEKLDGEEAIQKRVHE